MGANLRLRGGRGNQNRRFSFKCARWSIIPPIALYGYRGQAFHWKRTPFAVLGLFVVLLLFFPFEAAMPFTVLWCLSPVVLAGYGGESFQWHRFYKNLKPELSYLFLDKKRLAFCVGVLLLSAFVADPPAGIDFIRMLPEYLVRMAIFVAVVWWLFFRGTGPLVKKDNRDYLSEQQTASGVISTAQNEDGVFAGFVGQPTRESGLGAIRSIISKSPPIRVPVPIKISIEDRASVIGPPGTGKTAFLVSQLLEWCRSGRSFVCVDIKPEIYGIVRQALEQQGYKTYLYNPTAQAGHRYNILDDIHGPEQVGELSSSLIPSLDAESAVFNESARDFLDAIITHLRARNPMASLPDVRDFVSQFDNYKELLGELRASSSDDVRDLATGLKMTANNERLLGSIFATFRSSLRFLRYPAIRESMTKSDFSLSELCGEKVALFLQFEETTKELTANYASVLMGHLLRYLIINQRRAPVLLLLDEIGNMPKIYGLKEKLNTIRSRHLPCWLFWQSKEQMQQYGEKADEGANIILGACDMQMVFRLNDNATADWISQKIGTVDRLVEKTARSNELIFSDKTFTEDLVTEAKIKPHELQQLDNGEVVCTYRGKAWRGKASPYFELFPEYKNKRPSPEQCVGEAYAEK